MSAYLIVAAGLTLVACGNENAASGGQPGGALSGEWTLVEATVDGEPFDLSAERAVTLTVAGAEVSGSSACNSYFGTLAVDSSTVRFTGLGGTEMACAPELMTLEGAYLAALDRVREAANEVEQLVLTGEGVELRFDPVEAVEPVALVGTRLDAGVGCNHLGAEIEIDESRIVPAEPSRAGSGSAAPTCCARILPSSSSRTRPL